MASTSGSLRRLLQEIDDRLKGIERMVQQDVLLPDHREDVFFVAFQASAGGMAGTNGVSFRSGRSIVEMRCSRLSASGPFTR